MILADDVKKGDRLRVLSGETIPDDGIILSGFMYIPENIEIEMKGNYKSYDDLINVDIDFLNRADIEAQIEDKILIEIEEAKKQEVIDMENSIYKLR